MSVGATSMGWSATGPLPAAYAVLTIGNPLGNNTALTITPPAGGTRPVASTLIIEQLD